MSTIAGWKKHGPTAEIVIARSTLRIVTQHYLPQYRRSAAHMDSGPCFLCEKEYPLQEVGAIAVSQLGSETIHLLRFTRSQSHLIQAFQVMGQSLIGKVMEVEGINRRTLGARIIDRSICTAAPIDNYLSGIGLKFYNDLLRGEIRQINRQGELGI